MRFDIWKWTEANVGKEYQVPKGRLRVKVSAPAALYVAAEGYEVLAGVGTDFDLIMQQDATWRVEAGKGARVFYEDPAPVFRSAEGERYTNQDLRPSESTSIIEVKKMLRAFRLEQKAMMERARKAMPPQAAKPEPPAPSEPPPPADPMPPMDEVLDDAS